VSLLDAAESTVRFSADDLALLVSFEQGLQHAFDQFAAAFDQTGMKQHKHD